MGLAMYSSQPLAAAPRTARHHFMMYTPRAQAAFIHQQFFFEQREKLSRLLNQVGADAKAATNLQACGHYFELTTVVTQLLEEAQNMSVMTFAQIERLDVQLQPFADKVQMVETVAADLRTQATAAPTPSSKKRGRAMDDEEEEDSSFMCKRTRSTPMDYDMVVEPSMSYCGPYADRFLQTAWWTQQACE